MFFQKNKIEYLIVGLGNPGKQYENTRHNVGFCVVDVLAETMGVRLNKAKFEALTATGTLGGKSVLLMKPQTFMNLSGRSVAAAARFYKVPESQILVIFDDISLDVGRIRLRKDGSPGGHNGIKSIIGMLQTAQFPRVKVGVGAKPHPDYDLADWVLSRFSAQEKTVLEPAIKRSAEAVEVFLRDGLERASSQFNGK